MQLFTVLHKSAKYGDNLQSTTGMLKDGDFLYFTSDQEITGPEKMQRDFMTHNRDRKIYLFTM